MTCRSKLSQQSGFTLMEGLITIVTVGCLMWALTFTISSIFSEAATPQVSLGGNFYSLAPSFPNFQQAARLHFELSNSADLADSVLVFGGSGSHPSSDPTGPSSVLAMGYVPTMLTAMPTGDPRLQFSSWDQRSANATQFTGQFVAAGSNADLTVLTVQGLSRVTSVTQQRRYTGTVSGRPIVLYEVTYQKIDWSSGSAVLVPNPDSGGTPTYAYRVYYAANEDTWQMPMGATHSWYRYDTQWLRDEEAACTVVFADPYMLAGNNSGDISPMSRFIHLFPVVQ